MMKYVAWILFLILFVVGCNQQSQKVNAKLKISTANLIAGQNGGTMLYITNKARNAQRSIPVQENELTVVLEDGSWDFGVISWSGGNGPLSGTLKCAKATKNLTSADSTIFLQLAEATCDDDFFAPPEYRTYSSTSKINPLRIIDCNNIASAAANNDCSTFALIGTSAFYRIGLLAYPETPIGALTNLNFVQQPAIKSNCLSAPGGSDSIKPTSFQIPFGGLGVKTSSIIEIFNDAACSSPGRKFYFPNGFAGAETTLSNAVAHDGTSGPATGQGDVFIETGLITVTGTFSFPNTTVNTSSPSATFTLVNNHSTNLTLSTSFTGSGFNFDSGSFPGHSGSGACTSTLAPGIPCTIKLKFAPTSVGIYSTNLNLVATAGANTFTISRTLNGTGLSLAYLTYSPTGSITFPNTIQTTNSAPVTITLNNSGQVAATALSISFGGTNPGSYFLTSGTNQCGGTLNANSSCNLYVVFQPGASQTTTSANLNISYHNGNNTINLTNTHNFSGPGVSLLTGTYLYPNTVIGTGSPPSQSFTITNNTAGNLNITSVYVSGGAFSISTVHNCPTTEPFLTSSNSCSFSVAFTPTSTSAANGTITIHFFDSGTNSNKSIQATITGSGLNPANLSASIAPSSFGPTLYNSYKLATLTLANNGGYQASSITPSFSGTHAASFTQHSTTCNSPVLPNNTCDIVIKFTPPSNSGTYSASVQVSYARGTTTNGTTSSINLSGSVIELHVANGEVKTMIKNGTNKLIIGGTFDRIGPRSGGGVFLGKYSSTGCSGTNCFLSSISGGLTSFPKVEGVVNIAIPDGYSGYYIGGKFTKVGSTTVSNIAHISSTGSVDTNFTPSINDEVEALYFNGTYLFVGGKFTSIGGTGRTAFAILSTSGTLQTPSFTFTAPSGQTPSIKTIYPSGSGGFYIGGLFNSVNSNTNLKNIAKITSANAVDSTSLLKLGSASDDFVKTIASDGSKLYVGGKFSQATTHNNSTYNTRNGIASYDLMFTNPSLDPDYFSYNSGAIINKILFSGSSLYVGGLFTKTTPTRANFAKYSNLSGIVISTSSISPNSAIYDMALDGSNLYLGGSFSAIGTTPLAGLAVINGNTLSSTYSPSFNKTVKSIAFNSASLYAGGEFSSFGGVERKNLAEIDLTTGEPTALNIQTDGPVNTLVTDGTNVYVGGNYTSAGPAGSLETRWRFAVFSNSGTWLNLNPNFDGEIHSMLIDGSNLYVGGAFANVNSNTLKGLAKIIISPWNLDTSFNPNLGTSNIVKTMAIKNNVLYLGGIITSIGGGTGRDNLAGVNLSTSPGSYTSFNPSISSGNAVNKILPHPTTNAIYVAGDFSSIGSQTRNDLALVNDNSATDTNFASVSFDSGPVFDMAYTSSGLYAVGTFSGISSVTNHASIAKVDSSYGTVFSPPAPGSGGVTRVFEDGNQMFFGGGFGTVKGEYRSGISVLGK